MKTEEILERAETISMVRRLIEDFELGMQTYDAVLVRKTTRDLLDLVVEAEEARRSKTDIKRAGMGGIYADFTDLPDAVSQMLAYIKELEERKNELEIRLDNVRQAIREPQPGDPDF